VTFSIAVLASGTGSNLQALLDKVHGRDGIEIVCVGSNKPDAPALARARSAGIEAGVFPLEDYDDRDARDAALADWLDEHGVQLVVLAGFMEILSAGLIARFRGRIVNVHPSLLPAFPGVRSIEQALDHGVRVTGVTVHFVDEQVDHGPIIAQETVAVGDDDTPASLHARVQAVEHRLLPDAVRAFCAGRLKIDGRHVRIIS
jgi:phosphoribosylglycinamide formyltransferase-1